MTRWTIFLFLTTLLIATFLHGQTDTTFYTGSFSFSRNDTTFYFKKTGTLFHVTINLPKGITKGISYFPSGKIESIDYLRAIKPKNGYDHEKYGKASGFYENGTLRFRVAYRNNRKVSPSYIYYPNGKVQCKLFWDKTNYTRRVISFDENGKKISDVKIAFKERRNTRVDECE